MAERKELTVFPNQLTSGVWVRSSTGVEAQVVRTSERDPHYDEPLYRLRYKKSGVVGKGRYTRDELVELGCTYLGPA